jgi:hypothetical protein
MIAVAEDPTGIIKTVTSLIQAELMPEGGLKLAATRMTPATSIKKVSEQIRPTIPSIINDILRLLMFTHRF